MKQLVRWCSRVVVAVAAISAEFKVSLARIRASRQSGFCFVTAIIGRHRYLSKVFLVGRDSSTNEGGK